MANFKKSFYDWCIENGKEEWLALWDYEKNGCSPKDIGYGSIKKYYFKCPKGLHDSEEKNINSLTTGNTEFKCKYCNSFEQWCIENEKEDWLELWDYELNDCTPKDISYGTQKKYYFKCPRGLHDSELKRISDLTNGRTEFKCNSCNSFEQWCIENEKEDWLALWDYKLNGCTPKDVSYSSNKKYYFKCPKGLHDSEEKRIADLTTGNTEFKCKYCNSFGQWCIDNNETELLNLWDYKLNKCTPKDISYRSNEKYYFKCPRGLHDSELKRISDLTNGRTELICNSCNSFAQYLIDNYGEDALEKYWNYKKNGNLNPFKISRASTKKVWIKCQKDETHDSYFVNCYSFTSGNVRCPICKESHGERKIREYLRKNNIEFIPQKTFPKLLGTGNRLLSYDFYVPFKNLLVEFQGIQHYEPRDFNSKDMKQAEKNFEIQQEHDRRKREYAQQNNIDLLEISYIQEDDIEEILDKIFK